MAQTTLTLKLPFLRLNQAKVQEFWRLQKLNTIVANNILDYPKEEARKLTSKHFKHIEIGSAWINQTIRNANAQNRVKKFKTLPLETNNQNWTLHKVGNTYSLGFGLLRSVKKRVPLEIHQAKYADILNDLLEGKAIKGSLKLWRSKKGKWYALISVSMEVPDTKSVEHWVGVDRGQNLLAVASFPSGMPTKFCKFGEVKQLRRQYQQLRQKLQKAKKTRTLKKLESRESRRITHINHFVSKEIVQFAANLGCGIRLEDLSNIRQTSKQKKKCKRDAGQNRDSWAYYQLEQFIQYKAVLAGIPVQKIPAPYTSKTCCNCGAIGIRDKHQFSCPRCGFQCHSDWNASLNIGRWVGLKCSLELQPGLAVMAESVLRSGVNDSPLNLMNDCLRSGDSTRLKNPPT
jgi:IS605 OrfB family transposase